MTYLDFFQLEQEPFSNAPVSRFFYTAPQHQAALTRPTHATSYMKGLALLVGDIGRGKSTLARRLLEILPEDQYEVALLVIIHANVSADWLLRRIALQLGVEHPSMARAELLGQLYERLVQIYSAGRKAIVLIDEAQMLRNQEIMEELRGLLNLEVPERKLVSIVLFGLPELEACLRLNPALSQRVALKCRLDAFDLETTQSYVRHRLRLVGAPRDPFLAPAVARLHALSGGVPRIINTLCDNALFEAFLAKSHHIDAALIDRIGDELGLSALPPPTTVLPPSLVGPALTAAPPPPSVAAVAAPPSASSVQVELHEVDRFLEGLGKV